MYKERFIFRPDFLSFFHLPTGFWAIQKRQLRMYKIKGFANILSRKM